MSLPSLTRLQWRRVSSGVVGSRFQGPKNSAPNLEPRTVHMPSNIPFFFSLCGLSDPPLQGIRKEQCLAGSDKVLAAPLFFFGVVNLQSHEKHYIY